VRYRHIERADPRPLHVHVITINLSDPRVRVRVCPGDDDDPDGAGPWQTRLQLPHEVAQRQSLYCAVNGNYFASKESRKLAGRNIPYFVGNPARAWGWAMSDGKLWSDDPGSRCSLVVDRTGHAMIDCFDKLPPDAFQVVTGSELIVTDGQVTTHGTDRAPRTAVGLDRARSMLTLLVVDGRELEYSAGMTSDELAQQMIDLGCDRAIMLDGGGSSTMVLMDEIDGVPKVVYRPSDGHDLPVKLNLERPVADVVGVQLESNDAAPSR
jgi:exopolysaccharide biosynthesis protein